MATPSTPATAAASASATPAASSASTATTSSNPVASTPAAGGTTPATTSPASPVAAASPTAATPRSQEQMRADMKDKLLKTAEAAAKGELPAKEEPKPAEGEAADKPNVSDPEATGEQPKEGEEHKEGEEKPAEVVAEEENVDEEPFSLEEPKGPLPPRELQAKLKANPELMAALDKDPELKNSIFAASRMAQRVSSYEEVVGSPEEAKAAVAASTQFADLSNRFSAIRDEQSYNRAIQGLLAASTLYDDDGQPLKDANGNARTDGTVGRLIEQNFASALKYWEGRAKSSDDDELTAAVDVLKARAFGGPASAKEGMTEEQQRVSDELRQERERLNTDRRTQLEAQQKDFDTRVDGRVETVVKKAIESRIANAELDDSDKAELERRIGEKLYTAIHENPQYQNALDPLLRRQGYGKKKEDDRVALASEWANRVIGSIAREEMLAMGEKLKLRTQDRKDKAAARVAASKSEPATAITHTAPASMSTKDLHAKVRSDFKTKVGREPNDTEMFRLLREAKRAS